MADIPRIRSLDLTKPLAKPVTNELGVGTVINRWSDYPSFNLTPERLRAILWQADQGYMRYLMELFEEMEEKDGHLAAILQTRKLAVLDNPLKISPASDDAKDQEIAKFVEEQLQAIPDFRDDLQDLLDAIAKGYAASEIHWEYQGRRSVVTDLEWIHPKAISFVNSAAPLIITETNGAGAPPPPWKIIFHRYRGRSGDVCRGGVLRPCSLAYLLKSYNFKFWAVFNEVFGMPLRVGKYNQTASEADKNALKAALQSIGSDAYAVISENTMIEFVEAAKAGGGKILPYEVLIQVVNREMSKAVLGQTLTTESSPGSGTLAGSSHEEVRQDLVESDGKGLAAVLRDQLVRPLVGFNYGWDVALPLVALVRQESVDLLNESQAIKNFVGAGLRIPASYCYERFGISPPEGDEEVLAAPATTQPALEPTVPGEVPGTGEPPSTMRKQFEYDSKTFPLLLQLLKDGTRPTDHIQQELDNLTQAANAKAQEYLGKMLAPVAQLIDSGESLEVIKGKLLSLYSRIDTESLAVLMGQVRIMANLRGRVNE